MFTRLTGRSTDSSAHRLVVFHFGRCGSQVLAHLCESHPGMIWDGELFHRLHEKKLTPEESRAFADPLSELHRRTIAAGDRVYGFETKFQHLWPGGLTIPMAEYVERLKPFGFDRFILLTRSNYLRQAISIRRGMESRKWHYRAKDDVPEQISVKLDPNGIVLGGPAKPMLERFREIDLIYADTSRLLESEPFLKLNYEVDIFRDPTVAYEKLCRFANLKPVSAKPDLRKIGGQPLPELIENFAEIAELLRGTEFEWQLRQ